MTRDEWNKVLATEPARSNQRGAIMREFERLGFGDADQRHVLWNLRDAQARHGEK